MSRTWILFAVGLAGCGNEVEAAPSCTVAEVKWDAASQGTSYDHTATAELAGRLRQAVEDDRTAFLAGQATGSTLGALALETSRTSPPLVSAELYELALRLRQLDCAVQRGFYRQRRELADRLYAGILREANQLH